MEVNMGTADRVVRAAIGAILVLLAIFGAFASATWFWISIIVGLVLLGTATMKFCPLYRVFGIRTCRT